MNQTMIDEVTGKVLVSVQKTGYKKLNPDWQGEWVPADLAITETLTLKGCRLPDGYVIFHIDGRPENHNGTNLAVLTDTQAVLVKAAQTELGAAQTSPRILTEAQREMRAIIDRLHLGNVERIILGEMLEDPVDLARAMLKRADDRVIVKFGDGIEYSSGQTYSPSRDIPTETL